MVISKCCVGNCKATSETHKLFSFPKNDYLRNLWMSFLVPTNSLLIGLSKDQLLRKRVCEKHFDKQQFDQEGKRLRYSYPCLFTDSEIALGEPLPLAETVQNALSDHNYYKEKTDGDDDVADTLLVIGRIDNASNESSETKLPTVGDIETDYVWSPAEKSTENQNKESKVLAPFSWQMDHVPDLQDYNDPVYYDGNEHHPPIIDLDLDDDDDDIQDISTHQYKCNACKDVIKSDRFACAQCVDYDLCAQCAGERAAHRQHYLLRVPPRRPPAEVQLVLQKVRELLMSVIASAAVPLVNNTEETEIKMEVKDEEEATEDPLNVEETMATVPDMDDDNLEPHQEGDASTDTLNVEDNSDEIETTQLTLTNETHKRAYKNVRVRHSSPSKKKRRVIVVKNSTPVLKYVENTLPVTSSSSVPTDKEESSAAHSAQHRVSEIHRLPDSTIPLLQDIQQTGKPKQFLLQTVKRNDKVLLNLKNLRIVKVQTPDKT